MSEPAPLRVAVVNRGEAAMRFLRTAAGFRCSNGRTLRTVALFPESDRGSWFVREADEAFPLEGGRRSAKGYLDLAVVSDALRQASVDAAWVGWGFLAEDPAFADLCEDLGVTFIGPSAESMRLLGDKVSAKMLAEQIGVPVAPWSGGPLASIDEAVEHAHRIGVPLIIKASAGGGGRGVRLVERLDDLPDAFEAAQREARLAFGNEAVFLERRLSDVRHVEVQVAADDYGTTWALGVRDCSVQRRNQKLIEESASTALTPSEEGALKAHAVRLCQAAGYRNVGTVEFLFSPSSRSAVFMEVNTRLQVEHTVTEMATGLDLVALQLELAMGRRLVGDPPNPRGHAIEVRLNAEDPDQGFAPSPGRVAWFQPPQGPGVRVDAGVTQGDEILPEFDSMIAKLIAYGATREEALRRLRSSLRMTEVVVEGGSTNRAFLHALVEHPDFEYGRLSTAWLGAAIERGEFRRYRYAAAAIVLVAIESYEHNWSEEQRRFYSTARRGQPEISAEPGRRITLALGGDTYDCDVRKIGAEEYRVEVEREAVHVHSGVTGPYRRRAQFPEMDISAILHTDGASFVVEIGDECHRIARGDAGLVRAFAPGVVISVQVELGQLVAQGDPLVVMEAMKVESANLAPFEGQVVEVLVRRNQQVDAGDALVRLDNASGKPAGGPGAGQVRFAPLGGAIETPGREGALRRLRDALLGYEVSLPKARDLEMSPVDPPPLGTADDSVITVFSDLCCLSLSPDKVTAFDAARAPSRDDHLLRLARSVDRADELLPPEALHAVSRLLAHLGLTLASPRQRLEEGIARLHRAQRLLPACVPAIVALLDSRYRHHESDLDGPDIGDVTVLTTLVEVTDGLFPTVSEYARMVLSRTIEAPKLLDTRQRAASEVDIVVGKFRLGGCLDGSAAVERLANSPLPLEAPLEELLTDPDRQVVGVALEALARRRYRVDRHLSVTSCGTAVTPAICFHEPSLRPLAGSVVCAVSNDPETAIEVASTGLPSDSELPALAELFITAPAGDVATSLRRWLDLHPETGMSTVVVTSIASGSTRRYLVLQLSGSEWVEPSGLGDLHPATAARLELWRLTANFALERRQSPPGTYLFHAKAKDKSRDERLIALGEVGWPDGKVSDGYDDGAELVRVFLQCAGSMRREVTRHGSDAPLWNRITLYVRPLWRLSDEALRKLATQMIPAARTIGLEKVLLRVQEVGDDGSTVDTVIHMTSPAEIGMSIGRTAPSPHPVRSLAPHRLAALRARRRGLAAPAEIIRLLTSPEATHADFPAGCFWEYDLDGEGELVEVNRPSGTNQAGVVVGRITNFTSAYPEGMSRVIVLNDPTKGLGALAEPECRRIIAALDMAATANLPVEWFAVSSGAKVAMDSGVENMDWTAAVLRKIIEVTKTGTEINIITTGINVGAQSYFNAEATMMMHTKGILVMLSDSAMVLTGKDALDASGAISAVDNLGIGGFRQIMGPNGQAQYWAEDLARACAVLFAHYQYAYRAPGELRPRCTVTTDAVGRDITREPVNSTPDPALKTVGDIFSPVLNPERKRQFDMRAIMRAVTDCDCHPLERWASWEDAETAVVWDCRLDGEAVTLIGIESSSLPRVTPAPPDGPNTWTGGTLFPLSSKKVARAIRAATGVRPVVILANLSGFDGSPESMRKLQLEYGAEIGRAVTEFVGTIVFCVVSRYHGGAFVVFSKALNPGLRVVAVEGSRASVLGGVPAARVVFAREVMNRVNADERIRDARARIDALTTTATSHDVLALQQLETEVRGEKQEEIAREFDDIHNIERARAVGSVDDIVSASQLRRYVIESIRPSN